MHFTKKKEFDLFTEITIRNDFYGNARRNHNDQESFEMCWIEQTIRRQSDAKVGWYLSLISDQNYTLLLILIMINV